MGTFRTKLIKGTSYVLLASIIVHICGFFKSVIVARLLGDYYGSTEPYGIIAIFNNLQGIVTTIAIFSIPVALVKFTAEFKVKNKEKMNDTISAGFTLIIIISFIVTFCYFLLSEFIANDLYQQSILAILIRIGTFTIIFFSISAFGLAILQGFQEIKALAIRNGIVAVLQLPIAFIFVSQWQLVGAALVFLFNGIASVLILIGVLNSLFKKEGVRFQLKFDKKIFKNLMNFSTPVFLSGFVILPSILIINTFIALYIGYEETGLFRIAYLIRNVFINIPAVIAIPLLPMISELFVTNKRKVSLVIPKLVRIIFLITLPVIIGIGLISKLLITNIFGSIYTDAWLITYLLLINAYILSTAPILLTVFRSAEKTWTVFWLDLLFALIAMGLGFFLAISQALIGIAIAFILAGLILLFVEFIILNRNFEMDFRSIMPVIIISGVFIGLSFIILKFFSGILLLPIDLLIVSILVLIEYSILTKEEKNMIFDTIRKLKSKNK